MNNVTVDIVLLPDGTLRLFGMVDGNIVSSRDLEGTFENFSLKEDGEGYAIYSATGCLIETGNTDDYTGVYVWVNGKLRAKEYVEFNGTWVA